MIDQPTPGWIDSMSTVPMRAMLGWGAGDLAGLGLTLLEVDRLTEGVAEAWARLQELQQVPRLPKDYLAFSHHLRQQRNAAHALLVSAELFWRHLQETDSRLKPRVPALALFLASNAGIREATRTARQHFEHIDERIKDVRGLRWGPHMQRQTFREAPGQLSGSVLRFGDESFDLAAIAGAVARAAAEVAPAVAQHLELRVEARLGPVQDPAAGATLDGKQPSDRGDWTTGTRDRHRVSGGQAANGGKA